jgi:hypothetical protein
MRALAFGILAACVLAGPKLYALVEDGSMNGEAAMMRGGIVAIACAVGFAFVASLSSTYREAQQAEADDTETADEVDLNHS